MTLTITHTAAEGTMLNGTTRGDGTYEIMRDVKARVGHWRWARSLQCWIVVSSRDRQPKDFHITQAADALRAAGHDVEIHIDRTPRPTAEAEADRAARQQDRVDALDAKAARRASQADTAEAAHRRAVDNVPPMGEPIKIGHHSEQRHRNSINKAWNALSRSVEADRAARYARGRADAARYTTAARYAPVTVANRIDKLEAEQRADQRILDGGQRGRAPYIHIEPPASGTYRERVEARMEQRALDIEYWRGVRAHQIAEGQATNFGQDDISGGDFVKVRGTWYRVNRANRKTVSVVYDDNRFGTVPYAEVQDVRLLLETRAALGITP
ncbi:DUF3560 domain-containing protein [Nocardia puris]|uniref:DUF3560 domain-containing protein n=1 Tax=Nocardia puris TaxID=208602 RepID=UPI0018956DF5|nr:DUF3560 domain-containing protein [Nocardia puris]MBF6460184.1 DUF3560 domain-containing protein [Nocardia puris]